jgi:mRNA interferase RelE/StbE
VSYRVELVPSAARAFRKLDDRTRLRVQRKIESLADDPRPPGAKLLSAEERIYRLRAGDFRILYQVNDKVLVILVIAIGHRRDVYRRAT